MRLRTKFMILGSIAFGAALATPDTGASQALSRPDGWVTQLERFVAMPPGFHITTTPSSLLYHPDAKAGGNFEVKSEGFLFTGDSPHTYGLFVGGKNLERDDAVWTSLEIGHDGTWVVRARTYEAGSNGAVIDDVAGPETGPVVLPTAGDPTGKNVLSIAVTGSEVRFGLNGETLVTLPRGDLAVDGRVGFRVGSGLNLHLTTLSITSGGTTSEWAPAAPADGAGEDS